MKKLNLKELFIVSLLVPGTTLATTGNHVKAKASHYKSMSASDTAYSHQNNEKKELNKQVQMKLRDAGFYNGNIDGIIGNKTTQALKDFQRQRDINRSGLPTEQTLRQLDIDPDYYDQEELYSE